MPWRSAGRLRRPRDGRTRFLRRPETLPRRLRLGPRGLARGRRPEAAGGRAATARRARGDPMPRIWPAMARFEAAGRKLSSEEKAKRDEHPFDAYARLKRESAEGQLSQGRRQFPLALPRALLRRARAELLHVPAAHSQWHPHALAAGRRRRHCRALCRAATAHVTTRANLQLREIAAEHAVRSSGGVGRARARHQGIGRRQHPQRHRLAHRRHRPAGADRHPTLRARVAPSTSSMTARCMGCHASSMSASTAAACMPVLEDTNDIAFTAVDVAEGGSGAEPGVWFRLGLGGITGHRISRGRPACWSSPPRRSRWPMPSCACSSRTATAPTARRPGSNTCWTPGVLTNFSPPSRKSSGVRLTRVPPQLVAAAQPPAASGPYRRASAKAAGPCLGWRGAAGRHVSRSSRCAGLPAIAGELGRWRYPPHRLAEPVDLRRCRERTPPRWSGACRRLASAPGPRPSAPAWWPAPAIRAANSPRRTPRTRRWPSRPLRRGAASALDTPINVHLTGCPNSCAQHYIGDIGLIACRVPVAPRQRRHRGGFSRLVGGGFGADAGIGRELCRDVRVEDCPRAGGAPAEDLSRQPQACRGDIPCVQPAHGTRRLAEQCSLHRGARHDHAEPPRRRPSPLIPEDAPFSP